MEAGSEVAYGDASGVSFASKPLYAPPTRLPSAASSQASTSSTPQRRPFDESDERVYIDRQSGAWRCEVEGTAGTEEIEWDTLNSAWIPVLDEDSLKKQQAAYSVAGVDEETPAEPVLRRERKRQRNTEAESSSKAAGKQARARINTSIYVSGLPLDCDKEEIASVFSRYGVLNEDDAGEARIKMYADTKTGMFKGEALITYFKPESVDLAIRVLDDSALRAADGKRDPVMKVQKAEFGGGGKEDSQEISSASHAKNLSEGGSNNGQPRQRTEAEKRKAQKRFAKMNNKLTDWDSDSDTDAEGNGRSATQSKIADVSHIRQVCLRRMFTLAELDEDPSLLLDLKDDVREECESMGKVTNVVLWDKEPDGIMTVKFASHEAATACVEKMDKRFFAGRQVIAYLLEGKPRFRRSGRSGDEEADDENNDEDARRQDAFGTWLDAGGDGDGAP